MTIWPLQTSEHYLTPCRKLEKTPLIMFGFRFFGDKLKQRLVAGEKARLPTMSHKN